MTGVTCRCSVLLALLYGCDAPGLGRSNPDFLVVGHRGAPNVAPENTIPSFDVAVAVGANAIELDVCATEDDVLTVWHDADPDDSVALARQVGAEGLAFVPSVPVLGSEWRRPVRELTLAELRDHYGFARAEGGAAEEAVIPTFDEALHWAKGEERLRAIYVDLKVDVSGAELLAAGMEALASDPDLAHLRLYLCSVRRDVVDLLETERRRIGADSVRVAWDHEGSGALGDTIDAGLRDVLMGLVSEVSWHDFKTEVSSIVEAREDGRLDSVTAWTFDRDTQLAELLYYSVDGVLTNDPALLHRLWQDTLD